jgi:hypothetical protein
VRAWSVSSAIAMLRLRLVRAEALTLLREV